MRNLIRFGWIAVVTVLFHSTAFCQGPPPGSYRQTCSNIQMRGGTLFANCQDTDGRWRSTVLPQAYECVGDVPNVVFPCAALLDRPTGRLAIYYGCADTVTSLAFGYLPEIIDFVKTHSSV